MTAETFYCGAQTFAGSYHVDPQPPEWCEEEVVNEGDLCPRHEPEDDDYLYERIKDERLEP